MKPRATIPVLLVCCGLAVSGCAGVAFRPESLPAANSEACKEVFGKSIDQNEVANAAIPAEFVKNVYNGPFKANILLDCLLVDCRTWDTSKPASVSKDDLVRKHAAYW